MVKRTRMQEGPDVPSVIIPFPAPVVHLHVELGPAVELRRPQVVVEHDGRLYLLAALLEQLPDRVLADVDGLVPRTAQETWDLMVRLWPLWAKVALNCHSIRLGISETPPMLRV